MRSLPAQIRPQAKKLRAVINYEPDQRTSGGHLVPHFFACDFVLMRVYFVAERSGSVPDLAVDDPQLR
jgi:hypothetical protein